MEDLANATSIAGYLHRAKVPGKNNLYCLKQREIEQMIAQNESSRSPGCSLADAFRAGAQWAARNGTDNWLKLDGVAEHYEETGEVKDFPGFKTHKGFSQ